MKTIRWPQKVTKVTKVYVMEDQTSIQNRNGLLFFVTINQSFNGLISVLNTFPKEKVIVNREISSNAYKLNVSGNIKMDATGNVDIDGTEIYLN